MENKIQDSDIQDSMFMYQKMQSKYDSLATQQQPRRVNRIDSANQRFGQLDSNRSRSRGRNLRQKVDILEVDSGYKTPGSDYRMVKI